MPHASGIGSANEDRKERLPIERYLTAMKGRKVTTPLAQMHMHAGQFDSEYSFLGNWHKYSDLAAEGRQPGPERNWGDRRIFHAGFLRPRKVVAGSDVRSKA